MTASGPSRRASTGADARPPYEGRSRPSVTPHTPPLSSAPSPARYAGYLGAETAPVTMSSQPPLRAPATALPYRTTSARGLANPSPYPSSVEMASVGGGGSGIPVGRAPFTTWAQERVTGSARFDNRRLDNIPLRPSRSMGPRDSLPATGPEEAWNARRRHAPCSIRVPASASLDCHFLRYDDDQSYVHRLAQLLTTLDHLPRPEVPVSWAYLGLPPPFLPHRWPRVARSTELPYKEFPTWGDMLVTGEDVPRDSAHALYQASLRAQLGDPGRFLAEYAREAKLQARGWLVSWTQVEYHQMYPSERAALYPSTPPDWAEWAVPSRMYVPLPPSLTYVGSGLLAGNPHIWAIFFTEWVVLVFARWCTDAFYRGVLWRVPPRVRNGISHLGLAPLLQGSPFLTSSIEDLFRLHDRVDWSREPQSLAGGLPVNRGEAGVWELEGRPISASRPPGERPRSAPASTIPVSLAPSNEHPLVQPDVNIPLRSRPLEDIPTPRSPSSPTDSALDGCVTPRGELVQGMEEHSQHSGLRRGRDLSVACLEDWMWHLGIFDALDPYFPTGLMREEDIARAYAQLLLVRDRLQLRLAESERRVGEEALGVVRVNLAREQAVQQLSRVQEDLTLIMSRLSLQDPGPKNTEETQRNQGES
jgi:hypothetical protein